MYRSVFVDGKIANPKTGNVLDLRVYSDDENERLPYLQSVSLKTGHNVDMDMSITVAPPYDEALKLISKDQEWFRLGNTLALRWGYSDVDGAISDWHMGMMLLPEVDFGEEITVTISAVGYGWHLNRTARCKTWASPDLRRTLLSVAEEIAARYGMKVDFGTLGSLRAIDFFHEERSDIQQCSLTDLQFLIQEAQKVGTQMVIRNDTILFTQMYAPNAEDQETAATFQMYGMMDVSKNVYPMFSFSPESLGTMFLENHQGVAFFSSDPNNDPEKDVEGVVVDESDSDENMYSSDVTLNVQTEEGPPPPLKNSDGSQFGVKSTVGVDISKGEAGRFVIPMPSPEFAQKKIEGMLPGVRDSDASEEGIRVNFSSIALPFVMPGQFVRMAGVGDYFSAVYFLQEREVSISDGGAEMTCLAGAKGFPGANGVFDSFGKPAKKHEEPIDGDPKIVGVAPNPNEGE